MSQTKEKTPQIADYRLVQVTCLRCGASWYPAGKNRPKKCAKCQCSKWHNYKPQKKKKQ